MTPEENFAERFPVSRETLEHLGRFERLLKKWTPAINLIASSTVNDIWGRHFADCAQLAELIEPRDMSVLDLGSGAGFPGLVLAILGKSRTGFQAKLVEADARKCAFLRAAIAETRAPAIVMQSRIESLDENQAKADLVTARALAPLDRLLEHTHKATSARRCLFLKGEKAQEELEQARKRWRIDATLIPSGTDGFVVKIGDFARVQPETDV